MNRRTVRVICDAPSHAPKVANIQRFGWSADSLLLSVRGLETSTDPYQGNSVYLDDEDLPVSRVDAFGTSTTGPNIERREDIVRERFALECPLCGLKVVLKHEKAEEIVPAMIDAGMSSVTLRSLAAIV